MSGSIEASGGVARANVTEAPMCQCVGGFFDFVEAGPADMNDLVEGRELLGDPQPDIGCAADDPGIGMALVERSERGLAGGCCEEAGFVADEHVGTVVQLAQRGDGAGLVGGEAVHRGAGAGFAGGVDDRPVAGAAAEIARETIVDLGAVGSLALAMEMREQAHDNARRAKTALRPMPRGHRRLHRMQPSVVRKVLHRDQFAAVELAECGDAGVDRLINQAAVVLPGDHHGAGAAIAFGAAFLGSGRALLQPQPVEHGCLRHKPIEPNGPAFAAELDAVSGHLGSGLGRDRSISRLTGWPGNIIRGFIQGLANVRRHDRRSRPSRYSTSTQYR